MNMQEFNKTLEILTKKHDLTLEQLAHKTGISLAAIKSWKAPVEGKKHRRISQKYVKELIKFFAADLTQTEARLWAESAGRTLTEAEWQEIFQAQRQVALAKIVTPAEEHRHAWLFHQKLLDRFQPSLLEGQLDLGIAKAKLAQQGGDLQKAIKIYNNDLMPKAQGEDVAYQLACMQSNLAYLYSQTKVELSVSDSAMKLCQQALNFFKQADDGNHNLAHTYNHWAILQLRQKKFDEAEKSLDQAADMWNKKGYEQDYRDTLLNLGACYIEWEKWDESLRVLQEAQQFVKRPYDVEYGKILMNLGIIYRHHHELEAALEYTKQAQKIFEDSYNPAASAQVFSNLGLIYLATQHWSKADYYLQQSLEQWYQLGNEYRQRKVKHYQEEFEQKLNALERESKTTTNMRDFLQQHVRL